LSKTLGGPSIRVLVLRMMPKDPRWKGSLAQQILRAVVPYAGTPYIAQLEL